MKSNQIKSQIEVHIAVLLFGMTGLFGKFLQQNPFIIVLGRVFFSTLYLAFWLPLKKESFCLNHRHDFFKLFKMGILLALHWISFFAAIQFSNVAVGLLTFSTYPIFVTLFLPFVNRDPQNKIKWSFKDFFFGGSTLLGIFIIVPLNNLHSDIALGAFIGLFSGAAYGLFTIINEGLVKDYSGRKVAFYEHGIATIILLPSIFIFKPTLTGRDVLLLVILGTIFTGIGHSIFINGLKYVSAQMASFITTLEPIYAIFFAFIFLGETVAPTVYIGGSIILMTVAFASLLSNKQQYHS